MMYGKLFRAGPVDIQERCILAYYEPTTDMRVWRLPSSFVIVPNGSSIEFELEFIYS